MELQLVIKDTRNGIEVYQSTKINTKDLDKSKDAAKLIKDTVDKMRNIIEKEFEGLPTKK